DALPFDAALLFPTQVLDERRQLVVLGELRDRGPRLLVGLREREAPAVYPPELFAGRHERVVDRLVRIVQVVERADLPAEEPRRVVVDLARIGEYHRHDRDSDDDAGDDERLAPARPRRNDGRGGAHQRMSLT